MTQIQTETVHNYINGEWRRPANGELLDVINPALGKPLGQVPLSPREDVDAAVEAAHEAFLDWRRVPVTDRIQ
ncbi:MAG: aldehyde dehydrogenase family protein, partial [Rhodothermales bacterium]